MRAASKLFAAFSHWLMRLMLSLKGAREMLRLCQPKHVLRCRKQSEADW